MGAFMKNNNSAALKCRSLNKVLVAALVMAACGPAIKAYATDGAGNASATVVAAIALGNSNSCPEFGSFSTSAARFHVTGAANLTYAITLPADNTVFLSGTGQLTAAGSDDIYAGATLTTAPVQMVGAYTGTFTVSTDYN